MITGESEILYLLAEFVTLSCYLSVPLSCLPCFMLMPDWLLVMIMILCDLNTFVLVISKDKCELTLMYTWISEDKRVEWLLWGCIGTGEIWEVYPGCTRCRPLSAVRVSSGITMFHKYGVQDGFTAPHRKSVKGATGVNHVYATVSQNGGGRGLVHESRAGLSLLYEGPCNPHVQEPPGLCMAQCFGCFPTFVWIKFVNQWKWNEMCSQRK